MKNKLFWIMTLYLILLVITCNNVVASTPNFDTSLIDENKKQVGYLDLFVEKDKSYELSILIKNRSEDKSTYIISGVNAYTNQNGTIDYSTDKKNSNVVFTDIVSKSDEIIVKGKSEMVVPVKLKIPSSMPNGLVLGGIQTKVKEKEEERLSTSINQQVQMINVIKLNTTTKKIIPELSLKKVTQDDNTLIVEIENPDAVMFGELQLDYTLTNIKSSKVILKKTAKDFEMAPSSVMPLVIDLDSIKFSSGNYLLDIKGTSGIKTWHLEKEVKLTKFETNTFSNNDSSISEQLSKKFNNIYIFILILIIFILLLLVMIYLLIKKKKKVHKKKRRKK